MDSPSATTRGGGESKKTNSFSNYSIRRVIPEFFQFSKKNSNSDENLEPSTSSSLKTCSTQDNIFVPNGRTHPLEISNVLETIFKRLDFPSLKEARQVSALWNEEGRRQFLRHVERSRKMKDLSLHNWNAHDLTVRVDSHPFRADTPVITTVTLSVDGGQMSTQLLQSFLNLISATLTDLTIEGRGFYSRSNDLGSRWPHVPEVSAIEFRNLQRLKVAHDPKTEGWTLFPWSLEVAVLLPKLKYFSTNCCVTTKKIGLLIQNLKIRTQARTHHRHHHHALPPPIDFDKREESTVREMDVHLTPDKNCVQMHRHPTVYLDLFPNLTILTTHIQVGEGFQMDVLRIFEKLSAKLQHLTLKLVGRDEVGYCDEILTGMRKPPPMMSKKVEKKWNAKGRGTPPCVRLLQNLKSLEIFYYHSECAGLTDFSIYNGLVHLQGLQRLYVQNAQFSIKGVKHLRRQFWPVVNVQLVHCVPELRVKEVKQPEGPNFHVDHTFPSQLW